MEGMLATGSQGLYCGERPVQTYQMVRDVITCTPVPTGSGDVLHTRLNLVSGMQAIV